MVRAVDPKAERIRKRKDAIDRAAWKAEGMLGAVKRFMVGRSTPPPSEDCLDCIALQDDLQRSYFSPRPTGRGVVVSPAA